MRTDQPVWILKVNEKKDSSQYTLDLHLLHVQHSCFSTQSWGSVLPSIVERKDKNSSGFPLLFSNRTVGYFCAQPLNSCGPLKEFDA